LKYNQPRRLDLAPSALDRRPPPSTRNFPPQSLGVWIKHCYIATQNASITTNLSVRPSKRPKVCPSHVRIVCKRLNIYRQYSPRDAMQARPMPSCAVRLSLCLSVRLSRLYILSKRVFIILRPLSTSGSQTIVVLHARLYGDTTTATALTSALTCNYFTNKCIGDDTKAAAPQSLKCTKNKNKYGEKRFSIWRMEFLHPAMWHDHDIDFVR